MIASRGIAVSGRSRDPPYPLINGALSNKKGGDVSAPARVDSRDETFVEAYSPIGVNVPAFALNRALRNSRLRRAMNFTSIPFGHAAWHS